MIYLAIGKEAGFRAGLSSSEKSFERQGNRLSCVAGYTSFMTMH
ncbi:hypothetical protein PSDT_0413 [Parascardovia denticolens DSM 10105 = JCM 12538]|nr:hypothetical protein PSDT_0413 [Parascardovia denticolens DSM 10105 = JCM 12538]